jgi:hypothetical protein
MTTLTRGFVCAPALAVDANRPRAMALDRIAEPRRELIVLLFMTAVSVS